MNRMKTDIPASRGHPVHLWFHFSWRPLLRSTTGAIGDTGRMEYQLEPCAPLTAEAAQPRVAA